MSCGLEVGGMASAILGAGVSGGALGESAAGVLPRLASVVPMEAKLREGRGDFAGLLLGELNPDPLADYFGQLVEARCLGAEQREQLVGGQLAVGLPSGEVYTRERGTLWRLLWCRCRCRC